MSKLDDAAAKMIANLEAKSGKSLADWIKIVEMSQLSKHGEIVKNLKSEHGLTHGYANLVSQKARAAQAPKTELSLVEQQYAKKPTLRPIYDRLVAEINNFGEDVELAPKKAYVSLRRNKQFGLIQPSTKTRVDVGLNIKDLPAGERLEASGSFNSMVSHRVRLTSVEDVDDQLIGWLRQAYEQS